MIELDLHTLLINHDPECMSIRVLEITPDRLQLQTVNLVHIHHFPILSDCRLVCRAKCPAEESNLSTPYQGYTIGLSVVLGPRCLLDGQLQGVGVAHGKRHM